MAGGFVVDGRKTNFPGVYVTTKVANLASQLQSQGYVAYIGSFPFLEQGVAYLSTGQLAFERLSPRDPSLLELSNIVWNPSPDPRTPGIPLGIYLMGVDETTQAQGYLQDATPANTVLLKSNIWGPRGNLTVISVTENAALGGWDWVGTNNGVTLDKFRIAPDGSVISLTYANPYTVAGTVAKGFAGPAGLGVGGTGNVLVAKTGSDITVTFTTSVPEGAIDDTGAANTWLPGGPINGVLTFVAGAAAALVTATHLMVEVTGVAAGVAVLERYKIAAADIAAPTSHATTTAWSSITSVKCYPTSTGTAGLPGTAGTPVGSYGGDVFTFSGSCFPTINTANGQTYAVDVIKYISGSSTKGFTASTGSARASDTTIAQLDTKTATSMVGTTTLGATGYRFVETINNTSILVTATQVIQTIVDASTAIVLALSGGTVVAGGTEDYVTGAEELSWFDINTVVPLTSTAAVHAALLDHAAYMGGIGANERNVIVGAAADENYAAVIARALALNSERAELIIEEIDRVTWNGATKRFPPYMYAALFGSWQAGNLGNPLTHKVPGVEAVYRNSSLDTREAQEALIGAGVVITTSPPSTGIRVERWVTTYTSSEDPTLTEASAVDSTFITARAVRGTCQPLIGTNGTGATKPILESAIQGCLDRLVTERKISSWVRGSLIVTQYADRWEVNFTYAPAYPVNAILVTATVAVPLG